MSFTRNLFRRIAIAVIKAESRKVMTRIFGVGAVGILTWLLVALDLPLDLTLESYNILKKENLYGNLW